MLDELLYHRDLPPNSLYALFEPINNRFILIHKSYYYLKLVGVLFSSRYRLYIVNVSTAKNYYPGIIDNDVCLSWTAKFKNLNTSMVTQFDYFSTLYEASELINTTSLSSDEPIVKDIPYMRYLEEVLHELSGMSFSRLDGYTHLVEFAVSDVLNLPFEHPRIKFLKNLFQVFYSEYDFLLAKEKIQNAFINYRFETEE